MSRGGVGAGLEKLTNANRSVSSVNDRLFPVERTEIADWKSISEYMLHSNFGKALTGVIGGNFCAYTFILPLPCFLNICQAFWAVGILKQNKNTSEFPRINSCCFGRQSTRVVLFEFSQRSSAKCFNVRVIEKKEEEIYQCTGC